MAFEQFESEAEREEYVELRILELEERLSQDVPDPVFRRSVELPPAASEFGVPREALGGYIGDIIFDDYATNDHYTED